MKRRAQGSGEVMGQSTPTKYCSCEGRLPFVINMILCNGEDCPRTWFHEPCIKSPKPASGWKNWMCPACKQQENTKREVAGLVKSYIPNCGPYLNYAKDVVMSKVGEILDKVKLGQQSAKENKEREEKEKREREEAKRLKGNQRKRESKKSKEKKRKEEVALASESVRGEEQNSLDEEEHAETVEIEEFCGEEDMVEEKTIVDRAKEGKKLRGEEKAVGKQKTKEKKKRYKANKKARESSTKPDNVEGLVEKQLKEEKSIEGEEELELKAKEKKKRKKANKKPKESLRNTESENVEGLVEKKIMEGKAKEEMKIKEEQELTSKSGGKRKRHRANKKAKERLMNAGRTPSLGPDGMNDIKTKEVKMEEMTEETLVKPSLEIGSLSPSPRTDIYPSNISVKAPSFQSVGGEELEMETSSCLSPRDQAPTLLSANVFSTISGISAKAHPFRPTVAKVDGQESIPNNISNRHADINPQTIPSYRITPQLLQYRSQYPFEVQVYSSSAQNEDWPARSSTRPSELQGLKQAPQFFPGLRHDASTQQLVHTQFHQNRQAREYFPRPPQRLDHEQVIDYLRDIRNDHDIQQATNTHPEPQNHLQALAHPRRSRNGDIIPQSINIKFGRNHLPSGNLAYPSQPEGEMKDTLCGLQNLQHDTTSLQAINTEIDQDFISGALHEASGPGNRTGFPTDPRGSPNSLLYNNNNSPSLINQNLVGFEVVNTHSTISSQNRQALTSSIGISLSLRVDLAGHAPVAPLHYARPRLSQREFSGHELNEVPIPPFDFEPAPYRSPGGN